MIRLTGHVDQVKIATGLPLRVSSSGTVLAYCDTEKDAEDARRAFANVLLPRFTRDEAIELALEAYERNTEPGDHEALRCIRRGMRITLEALAAAGAFSDDQGDAIGGASMAAKLDAAGIR